MAIDYSKLGEITVHNQEEMDNIPLDFKGKIYIDCTATVKVTNRYYWTVYATENSTVSAYGSSTVSAHDNSTVYARGSSMVYAYESSTVSARGNSMVYAYESSTVDARGSSTVSAYRNSTVSAHESSTVSARGNSMVYATGNSTVSAHDNSTVDARGSSTVSAHDNSTVSAHDNSTVSARGNSMVYATGNSTVSAYDNSTVYAHDNSTVYAYGNSTVSACGNVQVVNQLVHGKIKLSGNAREVFMPKTIFEFMDFYGIKHTKTKAIFYKAVRKSDNGILFSDHDRGFLYEVGKCKKEPNINTDVSDDCGSGIHISHLNWALDFGQSWNDLAIIEVETKIDDIVLPTDTNGKVRTSRVKVLREVPLEECGAFGKILAKRLRGDKDI